MTSVPSTITPDPPPVNNPAEHTHGTDDRGKRGSCNDPHAAQANAEEMNIPSGASAEAGVGKKRRNQARIGNGNVNHR